MPGSGNKLESKASIDKSITTSSRRTIPKSTRSTDQSLASLDWSGRAWKDMPDDVLLTTAQYTLKSSPLPQTMEPVEQDIALLELLNNRDNLDISYPQTYCGYYGCMPFDVIYGCGQNGICSDGCVCQFYQLVKCDPNPYPHGSFRKECYSCCNGCTELCCVTPAMVAMVVPTTIASCVGFCIDGVKEIKKCTLHEKRLHTFFGPKPQDITYNDLKETTHLLSPS